MPSEHITDDPDFQSALPDGQDTTNLQRPPRAGDGSDKPDLVPQVNFDTGAVLDDLFKQATEKTDDKPAPKTDDKPAPKTDDKPAPKADDKPAPKTDDKPAPKTDDKPKSDILDSVELPPQAKARSGEAFAKVKELARQQIKERDEQIKTHSDKLSKLESDLAAARKELENRPAVDPALEKEVQELRQWRKQIDVEADPRWKEFDTRVARNRDAILAKLSEAGLPKDKLDAIRSIGVENVEWEPIFAKLPSQLRRFIEVKLVENENLDADKKDAIKNAKAKADEFIQERSKQSEAQSKQVVAAEQQVVNELLNQLPWSKKQEVKADLPPEQKVQIEAANKFADETQLRLKQMMEDRSPNTRAQMVVGTLLAYRLSAQLEARDKELAGLKESHDAELKKIKDELASATAELDRIKKASGAGRRPSGATTVPKPNNGLLIRPGADALDQLRAEVQAD